MKNLTFLAAFVIVQLISTAAKADVEIAVKKLDCCKTTKNMQLAKVFVKYKKSSLSKSSSIFLHYGYSMESFSNWNWMNILELELIHEGFDTWSLELEIPAKIANWPKINAIQFVFKIKDETNTSYDNGGKTDFGFYQINLEPFDLWHTNKWYNINADVF